MTITLYNTCPAEYDKKFSQILKKIIRPAIVAGRSINVDEIPEEVWHKSDHAPAYCAEINSSACAPDPKSGYARKRKTRGAPTRCKNCQISTSLLGGLRHHSDLTMNITII